MFFCCCCCFQIKQHPSIRPMDKDKDNGCYSLCVFNFVSPKEKKKKSVDRAIYHQRPTLWQHFDIVHIPNSRQGPGPSWALHWRANEVDLHHLRLNDVFHQWLLSARSNPFKCIQIITKSGRKKKPKHIFLCSTISTMYWSEADDGRLSAAGWFRCWVK